VVGAIAFLRASHWFSVMVLTWSLPGFKLINGYAVTTGACGGEFAVGGYEVVRGKEGGVVVFKDIL
jgi:hypothetical protein